MTTWLPIPGWVGLYEASDDGQVRSLDRHAGARSHKGRVLRPAPNGKGYLIVVLSRAGMRAAVPVHRLVAEAHIGALPAGWHTCHTDGDNRNNTVGNLRYASPSDNELEKVRHGRNPNSNKASCPQGHPYDAANTRTGTSRNGRPFRYCLACKRDRSNRKAA